MNPNIVLLIVNTLLGGYLYTQTEQSIWGVLTILLFVSVLFKVIQTLFESYIFIYILAVQAVLTWLVTPLLSYNLQNISYFKKMYKLWVKFMPVKQDFFYEFMFPATFAMVFGLWFVLRKPRKISDIQLPMLLRASLKDSSTKPFFLLYGIGIVSSILEPVLGKIAGLGFVVYLFSNLAIIAGVYLYYSPDKRGGIYLLLAFFFRFVSVAITGMFGELIFGLVCYLSILTIGYRARLVTKIVMVSVGIFLVLVLQAAKGAYRTLTWLGNEQPSFGLLAKVYVEEASNPTKLFKPELLFTLTTRFNQGQLTALVLHDVPRYRPYQNGTQLLRVAAAILRFGKIFGHGSCLHGDRTLKRPQ